MKTFIDHIADAITSENLADLQRRCYVFPSRRAGIYFRDTLKNRFSDAAFWSPTIISIEDFVIDTYGRPVTDDITLLFDLFNSYKKFDKSMTLEQFYAWGQVILSDFEEIDRYMADANLVYSNLKDIKDLQYILGEPEEVKQAVKEFQKIFSERKTVLANRFIQNWEIIRKTYNDFTERIDKENRTFKGRAFRKLAENVSNGNQTFENYDQIVFAGFNALSNSEELIISTLLKNGKAEVFFDCDKLYMNDEKEEAGNFLRILKKKWNYNTVHWVETDFLESNNKIQTIGCTQMVGQAKAAGAIIEERLRGLDKEELSRTAIVLGDENLLMPVLHSLPESVDEVNITMGYPFRNTTLFSFISRMFKIHIGGSQGKSGEQYPMDEVMGLLNNTLVSPVFPELSRKLGRRLRNQPGRWISSDEIKSEIGDSWLWMVFKPISEGLNILDNINDFLVRIFNYLKENEADPSDREIIYHGLKYLNRFGDNMLKLDVKIDVNFLYKLFQETFRSIKIPFSGEPLTGMQIMGFLETRALDFKNVIILGVNETKIPAAKLGQTYIPFAVRKAFNMPTFEEQEAIYAYHFKRVLQRAENAYILFNTEVAVDGSGEKSRFLLQLQHKLKIRESQVGQPFQLKYSQKILRNPMRDVDNKISPVTVEKSEEVLARIKDKYVLGRSEKTSFLSPTSLVTYIDCKLKFYLKYIAKVPEEELVFEDIDPRVFGTVVHSVLEELYKPFVGKIIEKYEIKELTQGNKIKDLLNQVLVEEKVIASGDSLQGKDILVASVIRKLVQLVVLADVRIAPFEILSLEKEISEEVTLSNGESIKLGGVVDRVDMVYYKGRQVTRIIDYKTGKVELVSDRKAGIEDPDIYLRPYFLDGKYKSGFQAYYYASLLQRQDTDQPLQAGIFSTRSVKKGARMLRKGEVIDLAILRAYHQKLVEVIEELINSETPFSQTQDISKCQICAYKAICRR